MRLTLIPTDSRRDNLLTYCLPLAKYFFHLRVKLRTTICGLLVVPWQQILSDDSVFSFSQDSHGHILAKFNFKFVWMWYICERAFCRLFILLTTPHNKLSLSAKVTLNFFANFQKKLLKTVLPLTMYFGSSYSLCLCLDRKPLKTGF